jgi:hypothetical protein
VYHAKLDPNNDKYNDVGLGTKYTHGIMQHVSPKKCFNPSLTIIVQDGTLQHLPLLKHVVIRTNKEELEKSINQRKN